MSDVRYGDCDSFPPGSVPVCAACRKSYIIPETPVYVGDKHYHSVCVPTMTGQMSDTPLSELHEAAIHDLKIWPEHFDAVVSGRKRFEVRVNDRGYEVGDTLHLREWEPDEERYTGAECWQTVAVVAAIPFTDNLVGLGFTLPDLVERDTLDGVMRVNDVVDLLADEVGAAIEAERIKYAALVEVVEHTIRCAKPFDLRVRTTRHIRPGTFNTMEDFDWEKMTIIPRHIYDNLHAALDALRGVGR